ncbi:hypothetical protein IHN63_02465 [Deinococcus sp. 6YEL10]|uniref:protein DpdH n=1 Tax=Deinococcus sp. 6YEL10 TaxID=2745870 RepID=UPI001E55360F|nr:protein DpdH [Deinococcus sp. 6YEL10]MCD0160163.1 hypothetical protein [Deinococcus sp. 6YEL10]
MTVLLPTALPGAVCWDPRALDEVITVVAAHPEEGVFLATHQPVLLRRRSSYLNPTYTAYSETAFRDEFLDPRRPSLLVPVIGSSGTGKSHLIRWLETQIEPSDTRRLVSIPKHRTTLKDVIDLILRDLEGSEFQAFRARLQGATEGLTVEAARWNLLTNLAFHAQNLSVGDRITTPSGTVLSAGHLTYLKTHLPSFLLEDIVRKALDAPGSVVDRFVREALQGRTDDKVQAFAITAADLPLNLKDVTQAGMKVRQFYQQLVANPVLREQAVATLNHFLAPALQRVYQLGGEDLLKLMRDVRSALKVQGRELILLIEDFALLQGIQAPLLEALIDDDQRDLCSIRAAFAVTSGYFRQMDTVHTRLSFVVDLDIEDANAVLQARPHLMASYLNAARWGEVELQALVPQLRKGQAVASRCHTCPVRPTCHSSFGALEVPGTEGPVGLYPFNSRLIDIVGDHENPEGFNPRGLLRGMRDVLRDAQERLPDAAFPSPAVQDTYGKAVTVASLPLGDKARLEELQIDAEEADRIEAVMRLWGPVPPRLQNLPEGLHAAFQIPQVGEAPPLLDGPLIGTPDDPDDKKRKKAATPALLQALQNWASGRPLTQTHTRELRRLAHEAISDFAVFEAENLHEVALKDDGVWSAESIYFEGQTNNFNLGREAVRLNLPLPGQSPVDVAVALGAYYTFKETGRWPSEIPDAAWRFREAVELWTQYVRVELSPTGPRPSVLPVAVETLYWSAVALGRIKVGDRDPRVIGAMLQTVPEVPAEAPLDWRRQLEQVRRLHPKAARQLLVFAGVRKGGAARLVNAALLLQQIESTAKQAAVRAQPPEHDRLGLAEDRNTLFEAWRAASVSAQQEADRWQQEVLSILGSADQLSETAVALNEAFRAAGEAGVLQLPRSMAPEGVAQLLRQFNRLPLLSLLKAARRLVDAADLERRLTTAASFAWADAARSEEVVKQLNQVLDDSLRYARQRASIATPDASAVQVAQILLKDLRSIEETLSGVQTQGEPA